MIAVINIQIYDPVSGRVCMHLWAITNAKRLVPELPTNCVYLIARKKPVRPRSSAILELIRTRLWLTSTETKHFITTFGLRVCFSRYHFPVYSK